MIELPREELRLLVHAAAHGAPHAGTSEEVARLRALLKRLQEVSDESA